MSKNQAQDRWKDFTSQSDEKCFPHKPGPSASRARLPSASPPPSVTNIREPLAGFRQLLKIQLGMSDVCCLNRLTSVAVIPTLSPVLNARSKFSLCGSICIRCIFYHQSDMTVDPVQNLQVILKYKVICQPVSTDLKLYLCLVCINLFVKDRISSHCKTLTFKQQ